MKKVFSGFLAFMLLLSCMAAFAVGAGAEETTATTLVAPNFYGIQLTAIDTTKNTQDIRFVSVLTSLQGELLGYKITADYLQDGKNWTKVKTYEQESNTVYRSLLAKTAFGDTEAVTATALGEKMKVDAKAIFAVVMTDVPTNIGEITFTVEAYVKSGETTVTSEKSYFILNNGVMSDKQVLFREDCNASPTIKAMNGSAKFSNVDDADGGKALKAANYQMFEIVSNDALKNVDHYTFEVDAVGANANAFVTFFLNYSMAKDDLASKTSGNPYNLKDGKTTAVQVQIRASGNGWANGVTLFGSAHATDDFKPTANGRYGAVQTDTSKAVSCVDKHHYAIDVDNSGATATIKIYVDGVLMMTATGAPKGVSNSIYLMCQGSDKEITIDNIKVTAGAYLASKAS